MDGGMQDFDYDLPDRFIAQQPVEPRDAARLLVDRGPEREPEHLHVRDLPGLLRAGDVLVVNDTRVLPARLRFTRMTGGAAEVLLLEPNGDGWDALVRPSRKLAPGTRLEANGVTVTVAEHLPGGRRHVYVEGDIDALGELPLPPYIHQRLPDPERYQTVFANDPRSVAAPTAGLHLTTEVLDACRARGINIATVDLAVGLDTFRPVTADRPEDHDIHTERYRVPPETMAACDRAQRVVAIGTTTVRALESVVHRGQLNGRTDLFIHGDFEFKVVDVLLTNFHLPRSSLLLLIDAFIGPRWRDLYAVAQRENYRFLSFGDAMLLERTQHSQLRQQ
jgi:S-adenosylmethionine:tRNA ribosyltransferase-isomerase